MTAQDDEQIREKPGVYLSFTECRRMNCGLSWDPDANLTKPVDLDLCYAIYDEYGRLINTVSGKNGTRTNEGGSMYHTGDEIDGAYEDDDERISLDLFGVPRNIHYIFFMVEVSSDHTFANVSKPSIRIEKGLERTEMINLALIAEAGAEAKAYVFARLDRKPGGWSLTTVNKYIQGAGLPEWENVLINFLPSLALKKREDANLPPFPKRGEIVPLHYSRQSRERVHCGLSWDAHEENIDDSPDLDLTCIMFDNHGEYYDAVSSEAERAIDESGAVYHSGDDTSGQGDGDDEAVSVELANLPREVIDIVFLVEMKTSHTLSQVRNGSLRIADSITDLNQISTKIIGTGTQNAFIFARLTWKDEGGWMLHNISEPVDTATIEDWAKGVKPYLK